ncbi:MAG TPA: hypothetical protein VFO55_10340 [Gemmatimonadaceae bacterium]|nr:hypothetical protein [Gemmatimonadaceae bacterium]
MPDRLSYKQTLFDRHGPDAGLYLRSFGWSLAAGGLSFPLFSALGAKLGFPPYLRIAFMIVGPIVMTWATFRVTLRFMARAEEGVHVVLGGGASTPYTEQNSYQQALVMQGRLDEALESLEAIIAEPDSPVDVRIRAAELYAREAKRPERAAELLREASRHPKCTPGEEVYSVNRLADLLCGPLGQPGRALVELRRLADRYSGSAVGEQAKDAIRAMKARQAGEKGDLYSRAE